MHSQILFANSKAVDNCLGLGEVWGNSRLIWERGGSCLVTERPDPPHYFPQVTRDIRYKKGLVGPLSPTTGVVCESNSWY